MLRTFTLVFVLAAGSALAAEPQELVTAPDAGTALALLTSQGPFDLVLTDLKMEGLDGLAVLKAVKAQEASPVVMESLELAHHGLRKAT